MRSGCPASGGVCFPVPGVLVWSSWAVMLSGRPGLLGRRVGVAGRPWWPSGVLGVLLSGLLCCRRSAGPVRPYSGPCTRSGCSGPGACVPGPVWPQMGGASCVPVIWSAFMLSGRFLGFWQCFRACCAFWCGLLCSHRAGAPCGLLAAFPGPLLFPAASGPPALVPGLLWSVPVRVRVFFRPCAFRPFWAFWARPVVLPDLLPASCAAGPL